VKSENKLIDTVINAWIREKTLNIGVRPTEESIDRFIRHLVLNPPEVIGWAKRLKISLPVEDTGQSILLEGCNDIGFVNRLQAMTEDQLRRYLKDNYNSEIDAYMQLNKDELINIICFNERKVQADNDKLLDTSMLNNGPPLRDEIKQGGGNQDKYLRHLSGDTRVKVIQNRAKADAALKNAISAQQQALPLPRRPSPSDNYVKNAGKKRWTDADEKRWADADETLYRSLRAENGKPISDTSPAGQQTSVRRNLSEQFSDQAQSPPIPLHQTRLGSQPPQSRRGTGNALTGRTDEMDESNRVTESWARSWAQDRAQDRAQASRGSFDGEVFLPSIEDSGRGDKLTASITPAGPFVQTPNGSPIPVDERKSEDDDTFYDVSDISDDDEK
jgi:hypothetical protein